MICFQVVLFGLKQHLLLRERWKLKKEVGVDYRPSTIFSFSLKMFFSSPRVDSIFSRENWFSPSEDLSLATQVFSSVTVLSKRVHSFRRVSTLAVHSSATALTLAYLSLRAATSPSASSCVVIFWAASEAAVRTWRYFRQVFSKVCTFSWRALTSLRSEGLERPSVVAFSAPTNQGVNSLIPVLYSAQNLTSSEKASQSFLTFSARSVMYLVILASSSLKFWASFGTSEPWGSKSSSVLVSSFRTSIFAAISSCRSIVLATRSSGSIEPAAARMASISPVALFIHPSRVFREVLKVSSLCTKSSTTFTTSSKRPTTSSFSPTALISLSRIFFLSSGMVMHMHLKLSLMSLKSPLMLSLDLLKMSCLLARSSLAASRLKCFLTFLISSSAFSKLPAIVSLFSAYPTQASLVSVSNLSLSCALLFVSSQPTSILWTCPSRNLGLSGFSRIFLPFSIRSLTTFLLVSNWTRDFSCLSMSSSTFSTQEGAMSRVEESMMPSRNSIWGFSSSP